MQHHIRTTFGTPVFARPKRLAPDKLKAARQEFNTMVKLGIVSSSDSPWASALSKTAYRRSGKKIFTTIDKVHAYPVYPEDISKMVLRKPFRLRNAPQTFQRFIDKILRNFAYAYIDDIFVASVSQQKHQKYLRQISGRLRAFGLVVNPTKCVLGPKEANVPRLHHFRTCNRTTRSSNTSHLGIRAASHGPRITEISTDAEIQAPLNQLLHGPKTRNNQPVERNPAATAAFTRSNDSLAQLLL